MQIIESSVLGVRSAIHTFKSTEHKVTFILFPMVHIGEEQYYNNVVKQLNKTDKYLYEGVKGFKAKVLTTSYKTLTYRKDLKLVQQRQIMNKLMITSKAIYSDMNHQEFSSSFKELTLFQRFFLLTFSPILGIYKYLTASRQSIANKLNRDLLKSRKDIDRYQNNPEIEHLVLTKRNKILLKHIDNIIEKDSLCTVGIVYGAAHIPVVINHLTEQYGYKVNCSKWITVFDI